VETRKLGNSDIKITRVGYGAWAIGGQAGEFAWGAQEDADSIAAIHRSLELGVNGSIPPPFTAWAIRKKS